ncbi:MAG: FtsK/SpoIIIE domain-containing protein [Acidimicrobiales bacterium]
MAGLVVGRRIDGRAFALPPVGSLVHVLIGGKTGGGKSVLMSSVAAALAADPNVAMVGIDLKLMELALWRPRLTALANTADDASLLLANVVAEIDRRNRLLMSLGLRSWEPELGHRIVVFIDELARLAGVAVERLLEQARSTGDEDGSSRADRGMFRAAKDALAVRLAMIEHIAAVGRAAGVTLVCATQYPTADVIDPQIRSQLGMRFMLRVVSREQVRVILGEGNQQHISPDSIPESEPGGFWCVGAPGDSRPVRGRSLLLTDATLRQRFRDTAHLRAPQTEVFQQHRRAA